MNAQEVAYPNTDRLWQLGFRCEFAVKRLPIPLVQGDAVFHCKAVLMAYPVRALARRVFSVKGPIAGETFSNIPAETFESEREHRRTDLKDRYSEVCARKIIEKLHEEYPAIQGPVE